MCTNIACCLCVRCSLRGASKEVIICWKKYIVWACTDHWLGVSAATLSTAHVIYKGWVVYQYLKRKQAYTRIFIAHSLSLIQHTYPFIRSPHILMSPSFYFTPFIIISLHMRVYFNLLPIWIIFTPFKVFNTLLMFGMQQRIGLYRTLQAGGYHCGFVFSIFPCSYRVSMILALHEAKVELE